MANDDKPGSDPLEAILKQEIGLDSDARDFVLLAGIAYWWHPAYNASTRADLQAQVQRRYEQRHAEPNSTNHDTRIDNAIHRGYGHDFRTLGELKIVLAENRGWRGVGSDNSKAKKRFDHIIAEYHMEPFPYMTRAESSRQFKEHLQTLRERRLSGYLRR